MGLIICREVLEAYLGIFKGVVKNKKLIVEKRDMYIAVVLTGHPTILVVSHL